MTEAVIPATVQPSANPGPLRIKRFAITDFRAFPGPAPAVFELDGKNLLVYGENGAGKSSLFHALQDFFSIQPSRNLAAHKNVFAGTPDDQCKVVVEFLGQEQHPAAWTAQRHPCTYDFNMPVKDHYDYAFRGADSRVLGAARRALFLDYKSLLDTNYKHGTDEVNLFEVAITALLREYQITVSGGSESSLGALWQQVLDAEKAEKSARPSPSALAKVNQSCVEFNAAFRQALARVLPEVNRILVSLGWQDVVLTALQTPGVTYKNARFRRDRIIEGQRLMPELTYRGHALERPQMFLNEARLSGLALALYLGGRLACTPSGEDQSLKLVVLDDVLVGLDHSNRLPVLNVLKEIFYDWQVVLLTHDRGWFDLAYAKVSGSEWCCYEIFEGDQAATAPQPVYRSVPMDPSLDRPARIYLDYAKDMLKLNYPEAAANYARQAMEATLRGGCEKQGISIPFCRDSKKIKAQFLLNQLKDWGGNTKVTKANLDPLLDRLILLKNIVMNPYSHPSAPNIPKSEVQAAVVAVSELLALIG